MSVSAVVGVGSDLVGAIGGLFGGGLGDCEKYVQRAGQAAANVSASQARQAWDVVGHDKARRILDWPPQSHFCATDNTPLACSGDWKGGDFIAREYRQRGLSLEDGARVLRAAGVPTDQGCSEMMQLAKIVLSKWNPPADPVLSSSGSGGGGGLGISTPALVALGALGVVLIVGRG